MDNNQLHFTYFALLQILPYRR